MLLNNLQKQDVAMNGVKAAPIQNTNSMLEKLQVKNIAKVKVPSYDDLEEMNLPGFNVEPMEERFALKTTQEAVN